MLLSNIGYFNFNIVCISKNQTHHSGFDDGILPDGHIFAAVSYGIIAAPDDVIFNQPVFADPGIDKAARAPVVGFVNTGTAVADSDISGFKCSNDAFAGGDFGIVKSQTVNNDMTLIADIQHRSVKAFGIQNGTFTGNGDGFAGQTAFLQRNRTVVTSGQKFDRIAGDRHTGGFFESQFAFADFQNSGRAGGFGGTEFLRFAVDIFAAAVE